MLRALSICGLGGVFLVISPSLRESVQAAIGAVYMGVQSFAPYSYILGILLIIVALITSFNKGSQPR